MVAMCDLIGDCRSVPARCTGEDISSTRLMASRQRKPPLVEGPAHDAAGDRQPGQVLEVGQGAHTAGGDHRRPDALRQAARGLQVRAVQRAVPRDVGVDDPGQRQPVELRGQRGRVDGRGLEPALGGDLALAGIEAQDQPAGVLSDHRPEPVRDRAGPACRRSPGQARRRATRRSSPGRAPRRQADTAPRLARRSAGPTRRSRACPPWPRPGRPGGSGLAPSDSQRAAIAAGSSPKTVSRS